MRSAGIRDWLQPGAALTNAQGRHIMTGHGSEDAIGRRPGSATVDMMGLWVPREGAKARRVNYRAEREAGRHMSDELHQKYEEALEGQKRLAHYVSMLTWRQQKSDLDAFHAALCEGVLALCKQSQVTLEMVRSYGSYIREIHRHTQSMQEGTK